MAPSELSALMLSPFSHPIPGTDSAGAATCILGSRAGPRQVQTQRGLHLPGRPSECKQSGLSVGSPGEPGLWPTPFPSSDPSHWQGYRSDPTRCSKRPGTSVFVTLSHEVRGQDSPSPAAPHPKLPLVILLLCPLKAQGAGQAAVPGPPHLSRRKRTKATMRATRETQWPR